MSITTKFYLMVAGLFGFICLLAYELYQGYGVVRSNKDYLDFATNKKSKTESPFVAMPIELPQQNEVVILQPRDIELPKAKEVALPKQTTPKQNLVVIKGATSALIPSSNGVIR